MKYSKYYRKKYLKEGNIQNSNWLSKLLLSIIVVLCCLIVTNFNVDLRDTFIKNVLESNINFGHFRNVYNKFIGGVDVDDSLVVSNTNILDYEKLDNSYKFKINKEEGIEVLKGGIIVYYGEKDGMNDTLIVQGNDGVDIWYSNVSLSNYSLYDYVSVGDIVGNSISDYYLVTIVKDGEKLKYEEYLG